MYVCIYIYICVYIYIYIHTKCTTHVRIESAAEERPGVPGAPALAERDAEPKSVAPLAQLLLIFLLTLP